MKVFKLKLCEAYKSDWEDEHKNLVLCVHETSSFFKLNRAYKKLSVRVSSRRQVLKDGWVRFTRTADWWVRRANDDEQTEIYAAAALRLDKMGIGIDDSFWVKVERG